jgi:hypothetical protein
LKRIPLYLLPIPLRPKVILDHPTIHDLLHRTLCRVVAISQSQGATQGSHFTFIIQDGITSLGIGGATVEAVDAATYASGTGTSAPVTGAATVTISSPTNTSANVQVTVAGYHPFRQDNIPIKQGVPLTLKLTPVVTTGGVTRGLIQYDLNKLTGHLQRTFNQFGNPPLWGTSERGNCNSSGGCPGVSVNEQYMMWISSEAVINVMGHYELVSTVQARAAKDYLLSLNPIHGAYREEILFGSLLPVLQQGGQGGCEIKAQGRIPDGKVDPCGHGPGGSYYYVLNNPARSLGGVSTNDLGANGQLAYQCINDFIRGGTNYKTWIQTIENSWNGTGFGSPPYQMRATGAAGCAILVCDYDPKGIFPSLDLAVSKLQGPDGSFPNQYTSLQGASGGDAESFNRVMLWDCPVWLAWIQGLKGSATQTTPYYQTYVPPSYI